MFWTRAKYPCSYRNRNPNFSARRISCVLWSMIIFTSYFGLTVLVLKILALNYEWYITHEAKEPVINVHEKINFKR